MSDTRYIILIEIDNKRALKLYREAHDGIETLWPGIEAYCAPIDKAAQEKANAEMAEYFAATGTDRLYRMPPSHYGSPYLLINRFTASALVCCDVVMGCSPVRRASEPGEDSTRQ